MATESIEGAVWACLIGATVRPDRLLKCRNAHKSSFRLPEFFWSTIKLPPLKPRQP
jgi:hypothetical protein